MKKYNIEDLEEKYDFYEDAINYFVNSDLENSIFIKQFTEPGLIYSQKKYWDAFATIIVRRGYPAVDNIKEDILFWWQDTNWPGFETINKFVIDNKKVFSNPVNDKIRYAHNIRDVIWFKNLLELYFNIKEINSKENLVFLNKILDYLEDDSWKEFDTIYFKDLDVILNI